MPVWNASRQDRTQWNGGVPNGLYINAIGRNAGEVFGVFADFSDEDGLIAEARAAAGQNRAERNGQAGVGLPPLAQVGDRHEPVLGVRESALVDDQAGIGLACARLLAAKGPPTIENTLQPYDEAFGAIVDAIFQSQVLYGVGATRELRDKAQALTQKASAAATATVGFGPPAT